ncbi:MAG: hypothetical protein ACOCV1_04410 [Bacillota bacterium]
MNLLMFLTIGGSILIFVLAMIAIILNSSTPKLPKDRIKIWNFMRQYTEDNLAEGYQTDVTQGDSRSIISYIPTDIEDLEESKTIRKQHVVVENDKVITFVKGTYSNNETIKILLPPRGEDLSKQIRETLLGKILIKVIEEINLEIEEKKILRSAMDTQSKILMDIPGMKLVERHMEEERELSKESKKKFTDSENKKQTGLLFNQNRGE